MPQNYSGQSRKKRDIFFYVKKINEIFLQTNGLNKDFFKSADLLLSNIGYFFYINTVSAALFSALAHLYKGFNIGICMLADYLHIGCFDVMEYMGDLEVLAEKELIYIHTNDVDITNPNCMEKISFELRLSTIDLLRKGYYHDLVRTRGLPLGRFFMHIERLCKNRVQNRQSYQETLRTMKRLLLGNRHLALVQKLEKLAISADDTLILLRFFHYSVTLDEAEMTFRHLAALYDSEFDFVQVKRQLKNGNHVLLKKGLIENGWGDGFNDTKTFRLTDKAKDEFLAELDIASSKFSFEGLKSSDSITSKRLFYPEKTQRSIDELTLLLQPQNFLEVQRQLSENSMRTGFACLFSGSPGTGKTETACQIARICGRDIMQVNIADMKSKWFGESEKQIKALFDKYRAYVEKCETTPVLLFNEADAIIGKRQLLDEYKNGPGQTENAIQNIILEEIENLNGILIATTNLTKNMDAAFERRFLYKIEFEKPDAETQKAIWCSLLSGISESDACSLVSRFDLSGGQIENIARKTTVHQVLFGEAPALEKLDKYCSEENSEAHNQKKIGFVA